MVMLEIIVNGNKTTGIVKEESVCFTSSVSFEENLTGPSVEKAECTTSLMFADIICFENDQNRATRSGKTESEKNVIVIHFIKRREECQEWVNDKLKISPCSGKEMEYRQIVEEMQARFREVLVSRPKKILALINPIGGNRLGVKVFDTIVMPLLQLAGISVEHIVSEKPKHFVEVMSSYNYKSLDGIVVLGGDGTLHEVINVLIRRTQEEAGIDFNDPSAVLQPVPIPLSHIPTGTTNTAAGQITGCRDIITSTLHIIKGQCKTLDILSTHCVGKLVGYCVCGMGLGAVADFVNIADQKLRWMKTSRYKAMCYLLLFRRVHYQNIEITFCRRRNSLSEGDQMTDGDFMEEETINRRTPMVLACPLDISSPNDSAGEMFVIIYKEIGGIGMYRAFKEIVTQERNANNEGCREMYKAQAVKIKFQHPSEIPDVYSKMVCIDGEIFTSSKPEFFLRITTRMESSVHESYIPIQKFTGMIVTRHVVCLLKSAIETFIDDHLLTNVVGHSVVQNSRVNRLLFVNACF